ncbi:MAG: hypothetical protein ACR2QB_08785, partial [Gammaproteobacteria bacterium]
DGKRGYSLAGMFSFVQPDSRYVTSSDLTGFMIEGFRRGNSIGTFSGTPELFKFDTKKTRISSLLQSWNLGGQGVNFGCILSLCGIGTDGDIIKRSATFFTRIDVSPKTIEGGSGGQGLSAPTGILALLAGLTAFAFRRRASR